VLCLAEISQVGSESVADKAAKGIKIIEKLAKGKFICYNLTDV
jgi:hypothetical protein